jgi:hypothetical protein
MWMRIRLSNGFHDPMKLAAARYVIFPDGPEVDPELLGAQAARSARPAVPKAPFSASRRESDAAMYLRISCSSLFTSYPLT